MIEERAFPGSSAPATSTRVFVHQLPLAYKLFFAAAKAAVLAVQFHSAVELRRRLRPRFPQAATPLALLFLAACLALVFSCGLFSFERSLLVDWSPPAAIRDIATVWVVGSLPAYLLWLGYHGWNRFRRRRPPKPSAGKLDAPSEAAHSLTRRDLVSNATRAALAAPFAVAGYGVYIVRTQFEVRPVEVKIPGLPPSLDGLRLLQVSDIHLGENLSPAELGRAVGLANETRPHIAAVTGDLITRVGDPLEKCLDIIAGLKADAGVWACMGNHEHYAGGEDHCETYARPLGIEFLRERSELLRFGDAKLNLCGVDYQRTTKPYLENGGQMLDEQALNVLLSHNPDVFPVAARLGYDFVLSGHTHGGQITLEIVEQWVNPGHFFTPFVAGEYRLDRSALYVSRGIGTVNLAMRVGALPEISLLTLRRA